MPITDRNVWLVVRPRGAVLEVVAEFNSAGEANQLVLGTIEDGTIPHYSADERLYTIGPVVRSMLT